MDNKVKVVEIDQVREKLIDIVEDYADFLDWDTKEGLVDSIMEKFFATDNNVGDKWISVKDRLPDKDGCYIVTACDEGCSCGDGIWYDTVVIEAEHYKGEWSWNENGTEYDITDFVTHWQPMPQPPEGE